MPLVSRTRATLRSAELGFLGVVVYTRVHTPRRCGQPFSAGVLLLLTFALRPLRTSCWIVGTGSASPFGLAAELYYFVSLVRQRPSFLVPPDRPRPTPAVGRVARRTEARPDCEPGGGDAHRRTIAPESTGTGWVHAQVAQSSWARGKRV